MSDKLAVIFIVTINGVRFENGADPTESNQPMLLEIEHKDQEASRLTLTVKDFDLDKDTVFQKYSSIPNPRCNPNIPVQAWAGWEDEQLVKVFEGLLVAKEGSYPQTQTRFVALHEAFKLRRKGKVDALHNITVADMLRKKAKEEGLLLQIHPSAASDPALSTPIEVIYQLGEPNWKLMFRYIRENGLIANTIKNNVIVIRRHKHDGQRIELRRGDEWIKNLRARQEHRRDERSPRRKGHTLEAKPGRFVHHKDGEDCGVSRHVRVVPPAIAKKSNQHKAPFSKFSVSGKAKRFREEGDELSIEIRFRPEMKNEEVIALSDFGGQIDGAWDTSSVVHRLGSQSATTSIEAWKR